MWRTVIRIIVCAGLVVAGWIAGRAQTTQPDFELIVNAPSGQTTVECHRGCDLAWVERGVIASSKPVQTFTFGCGALPKEGARQAALAAGSGNSS